jgi:hypothetical protein
LEGNFVEKKEILGYGEGNYSFGTSNSNESGDLIENFLRLISYFWR